MLFSSTFVPAQAGNNPLISREFAEVLRSGNARQLRAPLDKGVSANARDAAGNTALMQACVYGNLQSVRLLLERGAEVNATNAAGATPLMRAVHDFEKTRELIQRGAVVSPFCPGQYAVDARRPALEFASDGRIASGPWRGCHGHESIWGQRINGRSGGRRCRIGPAAARTRR